MSDSVVDRDAEFSEDLLRESETAVGEIGLLGPKAEALLTIAERHEKAGRTEKLRSTVSQLLKTAAEMRDEVGRVSTLAGLATLVENSQIELQEDDVSELRSMLGSNRAWSGG
jgi:hypothetical protein